jgi:UDP-3-O-[3-hydroxymyristoyl] glucosamine N-acyltransferase
MATVKAIAQIIGAQVIGNERVAVTAVASISAACELDLVFADESNTFALALNSRAAAVITRSPAENVNTSKPLLIVPHPKLAFARAAEVLRSGQRCDRGIDPTAIVSPSATVGKSVTVEPWVFVGDSAVIGDETWIGAGCVVGASVTVGKHCIIYPRVTIYPGTRLGNQVIVHAGAVLGSDGFGYVRDPQSGRHEKFPQIGTLEIEDDVEIGANSTIDRGALEVTRIGRGTKIDNLVHIGHNCQVGEDVIIAAQAGFSGSITIENDVVIGGQVGVGEHARIQEGVLLGGQAGVLPKKILRGKGVAFWGTPAKPLREYLKSLAVLAQLGRRED